MCPDGATTARSASARPTIDMSKHSETTSPATKVQLDRKLSRDEINALDIKAYRGPVEIVRSRKHAHGAVRKLMKEPLLGFDTETRPAFKKGVSYDPALVQLAGRDRVYIFQLQFLDDLQDLFAVLADGKIVKAGVSVADDLKELRALSDFAPAGVVDIGNCARRCGMHHHGLRGLAALMLGFRITKAGAKYNWSMPRLHQSAIRYAATDAWVGRELYLAMQQHGCI